MPVTSNNGEIIVTPEHWQIDFKRNFGDSEIRNAIIKGIHQSIEEDPEIDQDSYNVLNRLYNTWVSAGKPKIKRDNFFLNKVGKLFGYEDRANWQPWSGIHLPIEGYKNKDYGSTNDYNYVVLDDFINEISHPIQWKYGQNNHYIKNFITNIWNDIIGNRNQYNDPKNYEYETHTIVQPEIENYIYYNIPTEYIK